MSYQYGPHSNGARRLHTGSHPITETTCDGPQCWCNGGSVPYITTDEELAAYEELGVYCAGKVKPRDPLYTQAQVDALVAAAKEQAAQILEAVKELREPELFRGLDSSGPDGWRALKPSEQSLLNSLAAKIREGK